MVRMSEQEYHRLINRKKAIVNKNTVVFPITPDPKPRATQRAIKLLRIPDSKLTKENLGMKNRLLRHLEYKNELKSMADDIFFAMPESGAHITFVLPMPKSWSLKEKRLMRDKPHQSKPDKDNLEKGFLDAVCPKDDSHIWDARVTKLWGGKGCIIVTMPGVLNK